MSKFLCDLLPMRIIPTVLFSTISYFMMGFSRTTEQYFIFLVTICMCSLVGSTLFFLISVIASTFHKIFDSKNHILLLTMEIIVDELSPFVILAVARIFSALSAVVMMLFSGFIVDLSTVFNWISWIQWISACRYGSNILIVNEFQGLTFCLANNSQICPMKGEQVIDDLGFDHGTSWDLCAEKCPADLSV